jgi:ubiquitin-protein ligase
MLYHFIMIMWVIQKPSAGMYHFIVCLRFQKQFPLMPQKISFLSNLCDLHSNVNIESNLLGCFTI